MGATATLVFLGVAFFSIYAFFELRTENRRRSIKEDVWKEEDKLNPH
jgi:hypothetical protein